MTFFLAYETFEFLIYGTWLSEILTLLRHHQATGKGFFEFLQRISNLSASGKIMASLDVKSLFTNLPVNFTIDLVLKSVFSNNVTEVYNLSKLQLKKSVLSFYRSTVTRQQKEHNQLHRFDPENACKTFCKVFCASAFTALL